MSVKKPKLDLSTARVTFVTSGKGSFWHSFNNELSKIMDHLCARRRTIYWTGNGFNQLMSDLSASTIVSTTDLFIFLVRLPSHNRDRKPFDPDGCYFEAKEYINRYKTSTTESVVGAGKIVVCYLCENVTEDLMYISLEDDFFDIPFTGTEDGGKNFNGWDLIYGLVNICGSPTRVKSYESIPYNQ